MEFFAGLPVSTMRFMARHAMWRTKWISASKLGQQVFNGNISEWDINKSYLCYWSNFYDNIYNAHEPPDEKTIENDEFLDNWLKAKERERKSGKSSAPSDKDTTQYFFNGMKVNPVKKS